MTWVKVCGLTHPADVAAVVESGGDAVGFVLIPSSPRFVTADRAAELAADVPGHSVILTLDLEPEQALDVLGRTGTDGIQPYGDNASAVARAASDAGHLVLYPLRATAGMTLAGLPGIPLLDTPSGSSLGGTGRTFDWALVEGLKEEFVLAGGLSPENVADAVVQVRPWGVDVSSGLELAPGRKDHSMVADFITKAKST
ncbi:MAG: phosphoribosylanthranilate isomerase [Actinomycetota bacterium]|nr:phosphoribosylanthranilate isomerase [Actinomycetota bacterium]